MFTDLMPCFILMNILFVSLPQGREGPPSDLVVAVTWQGQVLNFVFWQVCPEQPGLPLQNRQIPIDGLNFSHRFPTPWRQFPQKIPQIYNNICQLEDMMEYSRTNKSVLWKCATVRNIYLLFACCIYLYLPLNRESSSHTFRYLWE